MLEKAVELDPRYGDARAILCGSYLVHFLGKRDTIDIQEKNILLEKASLTVEQTLTIDPENEIALTVMPLALMYETTKQLGDGTDIIPVFNPLLYRKIKIQINRLAELYPESAAANVGLGAFYWFLSRTKLPINKGNVSQKMLFYYNKAIDVSERIFKATPNDPLAIYTAIYSFGTIGYYYYELGKYQEALFYINGQK